MAVKVAEELPDWIVTLLDVLTAALELNRTMIVLRVTAGLIVTVQFAAAPTARFDGVQDNDCNPFAGNTVRVVLTLVDPVLAVIITGCDCVTF